MADMTKEELASAIAEAIQKSGGNSAAKSASPAVSTDGGFLATLKRLAEDGVPVYTAFKNIGIYGGYAANGLSALADKLPVGGDTLKGFVTAAEAARQQNLKNAAVGVGGNALFDLDFKAGKLGLSQDQYRQILEKSGPALAGLGPTAQLGSERLLKLGDSVMQAGNAGYDLVKSNRMQQEELAKITVLSQYGSRANLDDVETRKRATQSAGLLAAEIDKQAAITGKSRQTIASELEERLKQPEIMAQMRQMSEAQRDSFIRGQAAITGLGKDASDLGAVLARGGRLNDDQQKQLMAMGPAAGEFQRAMRMSALAQTDDQKRQASEAVERAKASVTAFQSSQQFANMMSNATPELAKFYRSQYDQNVLRDRTQSARRETGGTGVQAQRAQEAIVGREAAGVQRDPRTGAITQDPSQAASRVMGESELKAAAATNAMRGEMSNLNTEIGKSPKVIQGFTAAMDTAFGPSGSVEKSREQIRNFSKDVVNMLGGNVLPTPKAPESGPGSTGVPLQSPPKKKALGGEVESGEPAIVGDGGPELIRGPANVTSISETANILKGAVKDSMPDGGGVDIGAISDKINTTISSVAPSAEVAPVKSESQVRNEELKAKAEEALRIIKDAGEGSFETNIRITKNGNLRLSEQFEEHNDKFQSLGQENAEKRIAELVEQAEKIKARQKQVGDEKSAVEDVQLAKESMQASTRQQNIEQAYAAMGEMDPTSMFADLPGKVSDQLVEVKNTFDEFGTEIPSIAIPEPETATANAAKPTTVAPVDEVKTASAFDSIKTKFTSMFENLKLPDSFNTAKIAEPVRSIVPPPTPKAPPPPPPPKEESKEPPKPVIAPQTATLDDVARLLEQLNKTMAQVASHSESISEASSKTAKMSARATGNKNLA